MRWISWVNLKWVQIWLPIHSDGVQMTTVLASEIAIRYLAYTARIVDLPYEQPSCPSRTRVSTYFIKCKSKESTTTKMERKYKK